MRGSELAKLALGEIDVREIADDVRDEMRRRFLQYNPYGPQLNFHNSRALERIMSGANQSGKTMAGAMEAAIHLTGMYPEWWKGHKLKPRKNPASGEMELNVWVVGTDNRTVRDSLMAKIIGTVNGGFNNGIVHPDYIVKESRQMTGGTTGLVDNIEIRHVSGIKSKVYFRSYEQGRDNLQSATIDIVYCDEEPPEGVMGELKARLTATGGLMYMAFTPLKGMTKLVQTFWNSNDEDMFLVCMSIYEAAHMDEAKIKAMEKRYASLSLAERNSRMYGIPSAGTGMVYPIDDRELYGELPEDVPMTWQYLNAMDFGRGEHPNAIVFGCLDPHTDTLYIYDCEETVNKSVPENASLIRRRGDWIPTAFPHDLLKDSGKQSTGKHGDGYKYKEWYNDEGILMTPTHAKMADGSVKVESGIIEVRKRMMEGRLKVSRKCSKWFDEKNIYRYGNDNKPVSKDDHLMDATRYLCIMLRYAITKLDGLTTATYGEVKDDTDIFS